MIYLRDVSSATDNDEHLEVYKLLCEEPTALLQKEEVLVVVRSGSEVV